MTTETLATKIRRLRGAKRLTQQQLADACRPPLHVRTINAIELGENEPRPGTLASLADVLGVKVEELEQEVEA